MNTGVDTNYVFREMDRLIGLCEETGKFSPKEFGSRRFFGVGEYQLAFNGVFRFVEGNKEFRDTMPESYFVLFNNYRDAEYGPSSTRIHEWTF